MANEDIIRFGERLRSTREEKGLSQEAFANLLEVDRSYLGGVERGERNPSLKFIFHVCDMLHIKPEELFK